MICKNSTCQLDYPHSHTGESINDPAVTAPWPERLQWEKPRSVTHNLFSFGWFATHSKFQLPWKVNLDALNGEDWETIAKIITWKFAFSSVYGIPRGGVVLARALDKYREPGYPVLIVDDVLTTGNSFREARAHLGNPDNCIGVVVFARGKCPDWVWPICMVNEWAQSRATGLG
jgi:hypothetical protein